MCEVSMQKCTYPFPQMEAKQTAEVFEEFVASFQESDSSSKTFVRGSASIKPAATG